MNPEKQNGEPDIWNAVNSLHSEMTSIEKTITHLDGKIDSLANTIQLQSESASAQIRQNADHIRKITEGQKPAWGTMIMAIGLCTTLVTAIGSAVLAPLYLHNEDVKEMLDHHIAQDGHFASVKKVVEIEKEMQRLEEGQLLRLDYIARAVDDLRDRVELGTAD